MAQPVSPPLVVVCGKILDLQSLAHAMKYAEELFLLCACERPEQQLKCAFRVIDQHIKHIAVRPIGNESPTAALDPGVRSVDAIQCPQSLDLILEDNLLSITCRREQPANRIGRHLIGIEEPIDCAI